MASSLRRAARSVSVAPRSAYRARRENLMGEVLVDSASSEMKTPADFIGKLSCLAVRLGARCGEGACWGSDARNRCASDT
jgi:hypothetical protein